MSSNLPSSWNPYYGRGVQGTATTATTPPSTTATTTRSHTTTGSTSPSLSVTHSGSTEAPSATPSLSYSSWTVPSLDNLFSARRASAFGLRYGLSSVAGTMGGGGGGGGVGPAGGRVSPANSGMSMMMEGGSAGASLQIKARKMSIHMSETITGALNDSSLVLYRVNEHVQKKVPILVQEKKALASIRKDVETANEDMEDARLAISSLQRITEFGIIEALIQRSLAAVQK